jgi:hypothetical protein
MHWGTISLITVKSELVLCVVGLNILSYLHWPTALLFTLGIVSRIFVFRHVNGFTRCTRDTDYQSECVLQRHVFCRTNVNIKWTRIGFALRNYKKKTLAKSLLRTLFSIWLALCWLTENNFVIYKGRPEDGSEPARHDITATFANGEEGVVTPRFAKIILSRKTKINVRKRQNIELYNRTRHNHQS